MVSMTTTAWPDYPFQPHYFNINSLAMHYLDEGAREAPPVLMLHGNPSWSYYYRRLVTALKPTHRCIVPDHIGMGLSARPGNEAYRFTLAQRVDDLDQLIGSLQLSEPMTLVVHDWGGMIGMAWAADHPEQVQHFIILNTAAFHLPRTREGKGKRLPWPLRLGRIRLVNALLIQGVNAFVQGAIKTCVTRQPMPAEVAAAYAAPYADWQSRLAVRRFIEDIPLSAQQASWSVMADTARRLDQFQRNPVLICWGMNDFVFDADFLAEWERRFPAAEVHRFADAGHYVLEDASTAVIDVIRRFLA